LLDAGCEQLADLSLEVGEAVLDPPHGTDDVGPLGVSRIHTITGRPIEVERHGAAVGAALAPEDLARLSPSNAAEVCLWASNAAEVCLWRDGAIGVESPPGVEEPELQPVRELLDLALTNLTVPEPAPRLALCLLAHRPLEEVPSIRAAFAVAHVV